MAAQDNLLREYGTKRLSFNSSMLIKYSMARRIF